MCFGLIAKVSKITEISGGFVNRGVQAHRGGMAACTGCFGRDASGEDFYQSHLINLINLRVGRGPTSSSTSRPLRGRRCKKRRRLKLDIDVRTPLVVRVLCPLDLTELLWSWERLARAYRGVVRRYLCNRW